MGKVNGTAVGVNEHFSQIFNAIIVPRSNRAKVSDYKSEYVFSGDGKAGYLIEPRRQVQRVIQMSSVSFTLHDLRRTFITIAESIDISAYALKRLVNHKMTNDVTAGYIVSDVERLRKPMEQISRWLLQYFGIDEEKMIL